MKVAVSMKRIPDTESRLRVAEDGKSISAEGLDHCISPYDEIAVEQAVQLKEAGVASEVILVCLGPAEATKEIRTALAMGADRAIHLVGDPAAFGSDQTAHALAEALRGEECQLVLCGWKASDTEAAQVGPRLAHHLGLPFVNLVVDLQVAEGAITVKREVEGAVETVRVPLPCAVGCQKGLAEPRYPALKGIMMAKKKKVDTGEPAGGAPALTQVTALEPPPARPPGRIVGEGVEAVPELVRLLREEAKVL